MHAHATILAGKGKVESLQVHNTHLYFPSISLPNFRVFNLALFPLFLLLLLLFPLPHFSPLPTQPLRSKRKTLQHSLSPNQHFVFLCSSSLHAETHIHNHPITRIPCPIHSDLLQNLRPSPQNLICSISPSPFILVDMFNLRSVPVHIESRSAWVQTGASLDTAFPHRAGNLFKIQYSVNWEGQGTEADKCHVNQLQLLYNFMTPYVSKNPRSTYFNYRDLDIGFNHNYNAANGSGEGKVYGIKFFKENFERLVKVKTAMDPQNFFRDEESITTFPKLQSSGLSWSRSWRLTMVAIMFTAQLL